MPRATSTFETRRWNEEPYHDEEGHKLTRTTAHYVYHGDQEGDSVVEYLMAQHDGDAHFVGLEHFKGSLDGHVGTFVLQHQGTWSDGRVRSRFFVVPGSATDQLRGLRGEGLFEAGPGESYGLEWDYNFE